MRLEFFTFRIVLVIKLSTVKGVLYSSNKQEASDNEKNVISLVQQWAPKVWLHSDEKFFPSSVTNFLREVTPVNPKCKDCPLPSGDLPTEHFLVTKEDKDSLLQNTSSFLYGSNPLLKSVPLYARVRSCDLSYNHFIVTFWFFYAYNEGKGICTLDLGKDAGFLPLPKLSKGCIGDRRVTFGNHVGDWEHMSLEIVNSVPRHLYLSVHDIGLTYKYNGELNQFEFLTSSIKGLMKVQDAPPIIQVQDGHPVIFAAKGSHGLWAAAGSHSFTIVQSSQLGDETNYGYPWKTWKNLLVDYSSSTTPRWYYFKVRWGNPRSECLVINNVKVNVCRSSPGPEGLSNRPYEFQCPSG